MEKIKIMLVEDDVRWQKDLADDLSSESDFEMIKVASRKEEAVEAARDLPLDIILMDINLTGNNLDGIDAAFEISQMNKPIKIIMLTALAETEVIVKSIENGAVNYVNKSSFRDIAAVIRKAHHNENSLHSDATAAILREIRLQSLTPTEKKIFTLKEEGLTRKQMAQHFHTTMDTIATHIKNISRKLKTRR